MKNRLILTAADLVLGAAAVYQVSALTGGVFHDFCKSAVSWVLLGIGVAFAMAYFNITEQTEKGR